MAFGQCVPGFDGGVPRAGAPNGYSLVMFDGGQGQTFYTNALDSIGNTPIFYFDGTRFVKDVTTPTPYADNLSVVGDELWYTNGGWGATGWITETFVLRDGTWRTYSQEGSYVQTIRKVGNDVYAMRWTGDPETYGELVKWSGTQWITASQAFPLDVRVMIYTPIGIVLGGIPDGNRTDDYGIIVVDPTTGHTTNLATVTHPEYTGGISSLAWHNGELIAAGYASNIGGAAGPIARMDSDGAWHSLADGITDLYCTAIEFEGNLFAGFAGSADRRGTLVRRDGNTWTPFPNTAAARFGGATTYAGGEVTGLTRYNGRIAATGYFALAGNTPTGGIAVWNAERNDWDALIDGNIAYVAAVSTFQERPVAVGSLARLHGSNVNSVGIQNRTTGEWNSPIRSMRVPENRYVGYAKPVQFRDRLIFAGGFSHLNDIQVNCIAAVDDTTVEPLGEGITLSQSPQYYQEIDGMLVWRDALIAYGSFAQAGASDSGPMARWDGSTWTSMGIEPFSRLSGEGRVSAVAEYQGDLIVVGAFDQIAGQPAQGAARFDGVAWHVIPPVAPFGVEPYNVPQPRFVEWNGELLLWLGSTAFNTPERTIIRWTGSTWEAIPSPLQTEHGRLKHVTNFQGRLLANGYEWNGDANVTFVRVFDGTQWLNLNIAPDALFEDSATMPDGSLLVCGRFQARDGSPGGTLGRIGCACAADFNADGMVDFFDYADFVSAFASGAAATDINADGVIDFFDYLDFARAFAAGC